MERAKRTERHVRPVSPRENSSGMALIDRYYDAHLDRNVRSGANLEKLLRLHVRLALGELDVASVQRSDWPSATS